MDKNQSITTAAVGVLVLASLFANRYIGCKHGWHMVRSASSEHGFYLYCLLCNLSVEARPNA